MTVRAVVTVSRVHRRADGSHPEIRAFLTHEETGASMSVDDFVDALTSELPRPIAALVRKRLAAAKERVLTAMKRETARVV